MNKKFESILKHIPTFYYDVPCCPKCNSYITGHFIKAGSDDNTEWMVEQSLKHAEIVVPVAELCDDNCICFSCNHTWYGDIPLRIISKYTQEQEKRKRHTKEILNERYKQMKENSGNKKDGNFITRYVGHI